MGALNSGISTNLMRIVSILQKIKYFFKIFGLNPVFGQFRSMLINSNTLRHYYFIDSLNFREQINKDSLLLWHLQFLKCKEPGLHVSFTYFCGDLLPFPPSFWQYFSRFYILLLLCTFLKIPKHLMAGLFIIHTKYRTH
jgi:hypothetical protein